MGGWPSETGGSFTHLPGKNWGVGGGTPNVEKLPMKESLLHLQTLLHSLLQTIAPMKGSLLHLQTLYPCKPLSSLLTCFFASLLGCRSKCHTLCCLRHELCFTNYQQYSREGSGGAENTDAQVLEFWTRPADHRLQFLSIAAHLKKCRVFQNHMGVAGQS